jgi:hypothetical protein
MGRGKGVLSVNASLPLTIEAVDMCPKLCIFKKISFIHKVHHPLLDLLPLEFHLQLSTHTVLGFVGL